MIHKKPVRNNPIRSKTSTKVNEDLLGAVAQSENLNKDNSAIATNVALLKKNQLGLTKKKITNDQDGETLDQVSGFGNSQAQESSSSESSVSSTDFSQWYAQAPSTTVTDATSSSTITSGDIDSSSTGIGALSTGAMITLGALGVGAIAGIAIAGSKGKDTSAPVIQSITANSASKTIVLSYNEAIDSGHLPLTTAFTITTNGSVNTVSSISVSGSVMTLTLTNTFTAGALTISYTDPTSGNDINAIQDAKGNDASGFIQGVVADGYISGAQIYLDTNGNGIADPNEATGIFTNADGGFFLPSTLPNASIIAVGGINIDTGLAQTTPLKAPAGSSTINPLTTLVLAVIEHAAQTGVTLSTQQASVQVASSLGINVPTGLSLTSFDPLSKNDAISLAAQKAAAQIATIINLSSGDDAQTAQTIMSNFASTVINASSNSIDIGNLSSQTLGTLLSGTSAAANVTALATQISSVNTAIDNATNVNVISSIQAVYSDNSVSTFAIPSNIGASFTHALQLAVDTGSSNADHISYNGSIEVPLDYSLNNNNTIWRYTVNGGTSWTTGTGASINLANGTYNANQIKVEQFDGNNYVNTKIIDYDITIDKVAPTAATFSYSNTSNIITTILDISSVSWSYSKDGGKIWQAGDNTKTFTLAAGNYAQGNIKIKQVDLAGNIQISTLGATLVAESASIHPPVSSNTTLATPVAPVLTSTTLSTDKLTLALNYDQILDPNNPPAISAFSIKDQSNQVVSTIKNIAIVGKSIIFNLDSAISLTTTPVVFQYTAPAISDPKNIKSIAGEKINNFSQDLTTATVTTENFSGDPVVLSYIEKFASTLVDSASTTSIPMMGSFDLSPLKTEFLNKIQSSLAPTIQPMMMSFSLNTDTSNASPPLGYSATPGGDIFNIDYTNKTFDLHYKGTYNFGPLPIAKNAGFNLGEGNSFFKMGFNADVEANTIVSFDLNLKGGFSGNPLTPNFDLWLNQSVLPSTPTDPLGGSYFSIEALVSPTLDSEISGNIGPLTASAKESVANNLSPYISVPTGALAAGTFIDGFATILINDPATVDNNTATIADGVYNLTDLLNIGTNYGNAFDINYGINSQLSLDVTTGLNLNSAIDQILPNFTFNLYAPLNIEFIDTTRVTVVSGSTSAYSNADNNGWIYLDHMSIGIGDLVNKVFNPLLSLTDPLLQKIKPLVDFLQFDLIDDLRANNTGEDFLSSLIENLVSAINLLPGKDITVPTPIPTVNQVLSDFLLSTYDQVDMTQGEQGVVRVMDLFEGVTDQLYTILPKLEEASKFSSVSDTLYKTVRDLAPYMKGTIVVMREVSDFLASYYDFVEAKDSLIHNDYKLDLGTLAFNVLTNEFDTSKFHLPWTFTGLPTDGSTADNLPAVKQNTLPVPITDPATATAWEKVQSIAGEIGFNLPFLSNAEELINVLLNKEGGDIIQFKPDFSKMIDKGLASMNKDIQVLDILDGLATIPALSFLMPVAKYIDLPLIFRPDVSITPRIEAGFDNYALINKDKAGVSFLDSFYISDNATYTTNTDGTKTLVKDLPELEASIDLAMKLLIGGGVKNIFYVSAGAGLGVTSDWAIDLVDPNMDGKVRGAELLNWPDFAGSADLVANVYGNVDTAAWDRNYVYTAGKLNLFNFNTADAVV